MATFKNGILGPFKGKVGKVVGYELNGQYVMRGIGYGKVNRKPTPKELANRKRFAIAQTWLQPLLEFLRVGFQDYAPTFQGFSAAKSYLLNHAINGTYPDFVIDPALVLVSFGQLAQASSSNVTSQQPNTLTFTWEPGKHAYDDRAMFVAYNLEEGIAESDTSAAKTQNKIGTFVLSKGFSGKEVHVYLAFVSEDRKSRSNSQYLGKIRVL
ncbi:DUF6266 family protein [Pedobacter sp.]|jgi:hypothetical protein|uniref:DUF6266 family protein n=1 Tax=Pedobacter sp. TaxID=1411316 RepID=UPI002B58C582|nr:DUF6266 family protein [Pedobacter sp.]HWW39580.1 DUF6266 family protein [Pedobacter sp.]